MRNEQSALTVRVPVLIVVMPGTCLEGHRPSTRQALTPSILRCILRSSISSPRITADFASSLPCFAPSLPSSTGCELPTVAMDAHSTAIPGLSTVSGLCSDCFRNAPSDFGLTPTASDWLRRPRTSAAPGRKQASGGPPYTVTRQRGGTRRWLD